MSQQDSHFKPTVNTVQQAEEKFLVLAETARAVSSTLELEEVLILIANQMIRVLGVAGCTISRLNRTDDAVETWVERRQHWPEYGEEPGTVYPLVDFPVTRRVLEERQPMTILAGDPNANPAELALMQQQETLSLLMLPLVVAEQVIGLVELDEDEFERTFTPAEIRLCQTLVDHAAVAIKNAQLYELAQQEIAERKQVEEALAWARDQALASSRVKSEILARVSHELRTPLFAVSGFAELLEIGSYGDLTAKQHTAIREILSSSGDLLHLVDEMLDLGNIETGKFVLNIGDFKPQHLLEPLQADMNTKAQGRGLSLTFHIAPDMPAVLVGDHKRLLQILRNLIDNAIKFTEIGSVQVSLSTLR